MRKVIAALNITIDGFCDHTAGIADEELHDHYTNLLNDAGVILYGRVTYDLMQFWRTLVDKPTGQRSMDEFAIAINQVPKIVFSNSLNSVDWSTASLASQPLDQIVKHLKNQEGKDIFIGSKSLINQLMKLDLIDEYQLCIHPVVIGKGNPLFDDDQDRTVFQLSETKMYT